MRTHCLLCVIRYAMQLTDGDELDLNAADMNNNGRAEIGDALVILRSAVTLWEMRIKPDKFRNLDSVIEKTKSNSRTAGRCPRVLT